MSHKMPPNKLAGVAAGRTPEFIEMMQVGVCHNSGSVRLRGQASVRQLSVLTI
jgi:hypothetical protein